MKKKVQIFQKINMNKNDLIKFLIIPAMFLIIASGCDIPAGEQDDNRIMNLAGDWKFSIGDDEKWADLGYNDNEWESINVPSSWENEGFHGYNGYAWYRKKIKLSSSLEGKSIYLHLGYVDDVDVTYINGHLIGYSGTFPPKYESAYSAYRKYYVPGHYLNFNGENVIAVRVYDSQQEGGIVSGNIGFYSAGDKPVSDINLEGEWMFSPGDSSDWKNISYDDKDWSKIIVPGMWEAQGFRDYDGFAWYRKSFVPDKKFSEEKLVLLVGKIDDFDQVYLNEVLIGSTGDIKDSPGGSNNEVQNFQLGDSYLELRGYYIPDGLIKFGAENTIAVRVFDGFKDGGIYEGPVGIIRQKKFKEFWTDKRKSGSLFEELIEKN